MGELYFIFFVGIMSIICGLLILLSPNGSQYWGVNVVPIGGIFLCIMGVSFIRNSIHRIRQYKDDDSILICVKCHELFIRKFVSIRLCPKCNGKLVDSEMFLKKNPDSRYEMFHKIKDKKNMLNNNQ